jgi:hypothetical protein
MTNFVRITPEGNPMRIVSLLILSCIATAVFSEEAAEQRTVSQTIDKVIQLIDAKEYKAMIENCVDPAQVEKLKSMGNFDENFKAFPEEKAQALKSALTKAKDIPPVYNESKTEATIEFPKSDNQPRALRFVKVKEQWYVCN